MTTRIAINGFGRIGRYLTRLLAQTPSLELVTVNDIMPLGEAVHLLQYDSVHGRFPDVEQQGDERFLVNGSPVRYSQLSPDNWNWGELGVDIVVEATGVFTDRRHAERHLLCGAKRVVIAAPADDADITVVMGVNDGNLTKDHTIISNASCTTNCLALPIQHIEKRFGIVHGNMTTVHPYTMRQRILDGSHPDQRRARACAINIVPTPVRTHKTVEKVIPELQGKLSGSALRVPVANVALIDLVCELATPTTTNEVRTVLRDAADDHMAYSTAPLVSSDFTGSTYGSVVDEEMTYVTDGTMVRLLAWYDNEAGFTNQLLRLLLKLHNEF
ncbi:type I glyceraldehyde-3-phosphate dehydrogenase [Desulfovibrio mangrovi]|uniref:type I glyceraldehyde-3-phosphate dehydrogenase n=1 Tax=Desulfovibrio mangrovi TaxID=2976983 RepID=UPI002245B4AE|nr:glyceraldehyde 3-phosphate dehydrogenase NAD-binding domain-containing protein [Desulfovibrio mangrovi]UZP68777.1 type I glyceraldehyde-3-phosphate dehydrogenase [Desulfovibrio mangrovi]